MGNSGEHLLILQQLRSMPPTSKDKDDFIASLAVRLDSAESELRALRTLIQGVDAGQAASLVAISAAVDVKLAGLRTELSSQMGKTAEDVGVILGEQVAQTTFLRAFAKTFPANRATAIALFAVVSLIGGMVAGIIQAVGQHVAPSIFGAPK